ncbi:3-deoxy-manno-octulosonate cytidylyltransferase (CMP-KDO synthetase) [Algoriphagus alkaliphilus]|uniref:3-deoxy-manno-octulosonate cytidylyltransferase n=1 Tax=Algoriphagus alkaliphilus TaxID=279824 RepID=A0A1G5Z8B6_9BACT|nr:3-deoxy-manno-octulosonate cytidylyltransferase [Algoriphagus alkaliphilus]MBA4299669.1 3-deoxy-manno-octulosonate cytidylyltransferase [Cyclobacterium sp.]SDA90846.1 3-deoxy-manno-octulosonate cytidylyltransferase (CMP-KDO synthetase) [Algoriphagus alkaliphilus]
MKIAALIPARYSSTRLPAKLVQDLGGISVIQRTYLSTFAAGVFDEVWVVTDHKEIERQILDLGGNVYFSKKNHESGSDRIAEALEKVDAHLIVNVQGDEPFQDPKSLQGLVAAFERPKVKMASLMCRISEDEAYNPNAVKVVVDEKMNAIYFSRSPIPFNRERSEDIFYWKHVGVYAYTRELLQEYTAWPKGYLEQIEMLEQLRLVEKGVKIRMVETTHQAIAIDTKEDLDRARNFLKSIL